MAKRPTSLVHRAPCAGLPRGIYQWNGPDGQAVLFSIGSDEKLYAIGTLQQYDELLADLNARDPLPVASVARSPRRRRVPLLTGPLHLALVR